MRNALLAVFACALSACSLPVAEKGDACTRSAQCAEGLACVRGTCSANLQPIADKNMAPSLGLPDAAASDAASDGAPHAATDAGSGNDAG